MTESYDTDTFEDVSQSHSAQKGLQYWKKADKADTSVSASQSKDNAMLDPKAMDAYMKNKQGGADPKKRATKDITESSDKYTDEDFESYSKSASHSLPNVPGKKNGVKSDKAPHFGGTEIASRYV